MVTRSRRTSIARVMGLGAIWTMTAALTAGTLLAGERLGGTHKSDAAGFSMRIPYDWDAIPTQPGEKLLVGIWQGTSHLGADPRLEVMRWHIEGETERPVLGTRKEPKPEEAAAFTGPRNFKQWYERFHSAYGFRVEREEEVECRSGVPGRYIEGTARGNNYALGVFRRGGREFAIVYRAADRDWRGARRTFLSSIRSFAFEEESAESTLEDANIRNFSGTEEEARRRLEARAGITQGWYSLDTEHYILLSNADPRLVKDLSRLLETLRKYFEQEYPPLGEITALSIVRVCGDKETYHAYGGPPGSAGYWYSAKQELVFYEDQNDLSNSFATLQHEAFHQYIFYALGDVSPHTWFNEGNADYYAGAEYKRGRFRIGPFLWRTDTVKNMIATEKTFPLDKFIRMTQAEYYADKTRAYAQGWAFIYFLREETRNRRWRAILPTYFEELKKGIAAVRAGEAPGAQASAGPESDVGSGDDPKPRVRVRVKSPRERMQAALDHALEKAFEGVDIERLEKAFLKAM